MGKPTGLRTQLLLGLVLIVAAAAVSVGAITAWTARLQIVESQLAYGVFLGEALGSLLAPALGRADEGQRRAELAQTLRAVGGWGQQVDVVDRQLVVQASTSRRAGERLADADLRGALATAQPAAELRGGARDRIVVVAPVLDGSRRLGALRLELPAGGDDVSWPLWFWVLLATDGLLLLGFVGFVLTRYMIRPVELMQRGARRVTEGDLSVSFEVKGAHELVSLADSLSTMTAYLRSQLERLDRQKQELAATREQVIRTEKLASVGRLAAGVAHEVGNPLQSIVGFTDMLRAGGLTAEQQADFLGRVQGEAERIHRIVRGLLDFARPVEDAIESVRLATVVESALQLVGPQKKLKDVEVRRETLDGLPPVAANGARLVQVLVNLLLNAADAMAGQGTIEIRGSSSDDGEQVALEVANSGPAIPPADRGRIFDPFFTTKDPGEGTGLGLSVAQSIVESYGGRLTLSDDARTTFVVTLYRFTEQGGAAG